MVTDKQIKLIIGSLLHDIGKVVYRSGDGRNHSQSGYDYLKDEADIKDIDILNCVRYHHGVYLRKAKIPQNSNAYITYFADNIAAFADRRENENPEDGFDKTIPLDSVFNILNGNNGKSHYAMQVLDVKKEINYPTEKSVRMEDYFYQTIIRNITDNLKSITLDEEYLNSLLSVLEANLSYIPSSTSRRELADISLYDHMKMTAAIASCVEQYLDEQKEEDYRKCLVENAKQTYDEKIFLLYSMDISGIQKFIYTIGQKGALKGLRARSFYLEIMMEHLVDELLMKLSVSRANLIYTGGGHCYILLPNVDNLGTTFVDGFQRDDGKRQYTTLSRTATLSRQLSLFFKCYINKLLENGKESILGEGGKRKVAIVYSGGDDVFLVGAWNDVIASFIDLKNALERFTEGTLTISGGVGIYPSKYPLNIMAREVERLEECSKEIEGKNAITIFTAEHGYSWDIFEKKIINEKLPALREYFGESDEREMAFLYHLVELLRNTQEKINTARYVYLLSRMEPEKDADKKKIDDYKKFSKKMYIWSKEENEREELITAIYLYVYLNRERGEQTDEINGR